MKSRDQFIADYLLQRVAQLEVEKASLLHQLDDAARQVEQLKLESKPEVEKEDAGVAAGSEN